MRRAKTKYYYIVYEYATVTERGTGASIRCVSNYKWFPIGAMVDNIKSTAFKGTKVQTLFLRSWQELTKEQYEEYDAYLRK